MQTLKSVTGISNLYIVRTLGYFSTNAFYSISNLTETIGGFTIIDNYLERSNTEVQAANACQLLSSACEKADPDGGGRCIVVNIMERDYHSLFFQKYKDNDKLSPEKQPVISFTLDEAVMESNWTFV